MILLALLLNLLKNFQEATSLFHSVRSLCRLPEKTLKPHATLTYIVGLSSDRCSQIDIQWSWDLKKSDDLSIPKAMYASDVVQDILGKKNGPLSSFRSGRNGCTIYDDSNNSKAIAYDAYQRSSSQYPREFSHLLQVLFQEANNIPLAVVQIKKAINWDWICSGNQIAFTMLCLKHLDHAEQSQFANFWTQQRICFYFPKRNVIWIDIRGIDSNILVKLMNYAEVPIPTSNKQGAFSVTLQGNGTLSNSHSYHLECKIGRIGAITVIPVQVRVEEVQPLIGEALEKTKLAQVLLKKYPAYNFKEVVCTDEEGNSCDMIQFLVPQRFESDFPCQCSAEEVTFVVDHALPYSLPLSIPSRPPTEETRRDHWNKAACFRHSGKKGRRNQIVAKRGCPGSMNRAHCLQEGIIQCGHRKINTSFECRNFPLLFIAGDVSDTVALEHIKCMPSSDLRGHIETVMARPNLPQVPVTERRNEVPVLYLLEVEGNRAQ